MNSTQVQKEQNDDCVTSKIPKVSKSPCKTDHSTNAKKHVCNDESKKTVPIVKNKLPETKKPCSAMILPIPKSSRTSHLASSQSYINTHRSSKSREPTPRINRLDKTSDKLQKTAAERVLINKNIQAFESIKDKVQSLQTELLRRLEVVKDELNPQEIDYKLMCLIKNNEGKLVVKNPEHFKIKCAEKPLEDFKNDMQTQIKSIHQLYLNSLDDLKNSSGKIGDNPALNAIEDIKTKLKIDNSKVMADFLKMFDNLKVGENTSESSLSAELEAKIANLKKEIEELQLSNKKLKNNELDKTNPYKQELEEQTEKLNRKTLEVDELIQKVDCFEKDKERQTKIEEKLNKRAAECDDLTRKLHTSTELKVTLQAKVEQQEKEIERFQADLSNVMKDFKKQTTKNQEQERKIKTLEADLAAARTELDKKPSTEDQATKHVSDMRTLKLDLANAFKEKEKLSTEVQHLKKETEMLSKMSDELSKSKEAIKIKEEQNHNLVKDLSTLNEQLQAMTNKALNSSDLQEELSNLKKAEIENKQKIENLELLQAKANFRNNQLEERIAMDRKLLKLRSSLIDSLQSKETNQKVRLDNFFVDVGMKNFDIQMLKTDVLTKTEEFQNLFSTLTVKQLELTRQEHTIKLLKESNDRAQTIRARQESKIGQLEEEVAQLKQAISVYQDAVLPTTMMKHNLLMIEAGSRSQPNESLDYYVDERRKKRHIDIKVKKYEK